MDSPLAAPGDGKSSHVYALARSLFMRALSLLPEERDAFLDSVAPGTDAAAIAQAREMLQLYAATPAEERPPSIDWLAPLHAPERVGSYRRIRLLGEGGMGHVYLGENESGDRAAIKILRPGLFSDQAARRFRVEALVLETLQHPGIVRFIESGEISGLPGARYLLMEYVEGRSLIEHCREHNLTDGDRLRLLQLVSAAVGHAHERGVIHRDLKPSNILVTPEGVPKILDFGLARSLHPSMQAISQATASGLLMGTIRYMSPEQARGTSPDIGPSSDVYTLGVLGYEMLTGRLPYRIQGDETFARVLAAILTEEPSTLGDTRPDLDDDLDRVFARALARDPTDRYIDANQLAEELARHLRGEPVQARRFAPRRWRRPIALGAVALSLLSIAPFAYRWRANAEAERSLGAAYAALSEMETLRHPEPETREELDRMVELLLHASAELTRLPPSDFAGHLLRFTHWRLGECYYWLGIEDPDVLMLQRARETWRRAGSYPFDRSIGERLHHSLTFRTAVVGDSEHTPMSGMALVSEFLANFDRPRDNLLRSIAARASLAHRSQYNLDEDFTDEMRLQHPPESRRHHLGIALHVYGASLVHFGAVCDSLPAVTTGLRQLAAADTVGTFSQVTTAYSAYLRDHARAYLRKAELTRQLADTDSALARLDEAFLFADAVISPRAHASAQMVAAEIHVLRAFLRAEPPGSAPAAALRRAPATIGASDLAAARQAITAVRAHGDTTNAKLALDLALLESRRHRASALLGLLRSADGGGVVDSSAMPGTAAQHLREADRWLHEARQCLHRIDFPVPRSRVELEAARVASAWYQLEPSEERLAAVRAAVGASAATLSRVDAPRHHRELDELRSGLPG